jgi:hypothetical protein
LKGLPSGSTVVFTYIGFFWIKVTGNNSGLNVSLVGDKSLDEVVIGYGSQKKGSDRCRIYCR